jgi:peptidoglycan/LPS O-acetylase OafA/YrhL
MSGYPPAMKKSSVSRVECLDGLRGIAALWVLLGHCAILTGLSLPVIDKPDLGVDLFMMLSGFLMVFHYHLRSQVEPWSAPGTWAKFWVRRFFRIAPLYYVTLTIALVLGPTIFAWRTAIERFIHLPPLAPPQTYIDHSLTNIAAHASFLFGLWPQYAVRTPLPDWSLGLEMQFYAVFPALMLLTRTFGWMRAATFAALAGAVITHATWHYAFRFPMPAFLPFRIDIFLAGMLLAQSNHEGRRTALLYLALALILALQPFQGEGSLERLAVREILVLVFFTLILNRYLPERLGGGARKLALLLGQNPFRWLGEVSYSVYLLHLPIIAPVVAFLVLRFGHRIPAWVHFTIAFLAVSAIVYPLSWLTYRYIEMPGQSAGRRFLLRLSGKRADARTDRPESLAAP